MDYKLHFPLEADFDMHFYAALIDDERPPYAYPHHIESEVELFILVEGDISFAVESRVYKMRPGDIILTKPNEMHHCIRNSKTVNRHFCFYFSPSQTAIFEDFLSHSLGCDNLISPAGEDRAEILRTAEKLTRASEEGGDRLHLFSLAVRLLSLVKRNLSRGTEAEPLPPALERALFEVDERLAELHSFESVCEELFISRSTLNRLFKKHLNTTPRMYLEGKRLAVARRMLQNGAGVGETCHAVGFADTSSFIRLFKKHFGETPLKYSQKTN